MNKKKVKMRVKKRKVNLKKITKLLISFLIVYYLILYIINIPIKNIYVKNNVLVKDKDIITDGKINDYPSFFLTSKEKIKKGIMTNKLIKNVSITKKIDFKLYIDVLEYKILCIDKNNKLYLENGEQIENTFNVLDVPILNNEVGDIYDNFIEKFALVQDDILLKISEIEYAPVEVDKERFLLKMNDGNYVYITLSKIKKINKYNSIYDEMFGKKGIIYLDSGNYIEVKENN